MFQATLRLKATDLPKCDTFSKADPYFEVWHQNTKLYKSETIKNTDKNVVWKPAEFSLPLYMYAAMGDLKVPNFSDMAGEVAEMTGRSLNLKIIVWDEDTVSDDDLLLEIENISYPFRLKTYTGRSWIDVR